MNYRRRSPAQSDPFQTARSNPQSQPASSSDTSLKNKSVSFRPLGAKTDVHGIATGRVVEDCIEILHYQPVKILVAKDRVNVSNPDTVSPLVTSLTVKKTLRMTTKSHPATGWLTEGSRGKMLYMHKVGTKNKSITLHNRREHVLIYLLNQMRIPCQQVKDSLAAFRSKPEAALDRLVEQEIFTTKHLEAILQAEVVDWEVATIVQRLGIVFG